jgi:hypothetical protein
MKRIRNDSEGYKRGVRGFASDEKAFRRPESTVWEPTPTEIAEREFSDDRNSNGGDKWATESRNDAGLRNKLPYEAVEDVRTVWDDVKDVGDYETDTAFTGAVVEAKGRAQPNSYQGNQKKDSKW